MRLPPSFHSLFHLDPELRNNPLHGLRSELPAVLMQDTLGDLCVGDSCQMHLHHLPVLGLQGMRATVAGAVITRQRPGTAKGFIFLTLEDETGNANVIVMPDIYEKYRQAVLEPRFVCVTGTVQNQDDIVHLRAEHVEPLIVSAAQMASHDFH